MNRHISWLWHATGFVKRSNFGWYWMVTLDPNSGSQAGSIADTLRELEQNTEALLRWSLRSFGFQWSPNTPWWVLFHHMKFIGSENVPLHPSRSNFTRSAWVIFGPMSMCDWGQLSDANGTDPNILRAETSIGKMSVMRWARAAGAELNSSVDGEYAQLVDETSGAVLPLEAEGLEGWKWPADQNDFTGAYEIRNAVWIFAGVKTVQSLGPAWWPW